MPLYDFDCECGESTEAIRKAGTVSITCACGREAQRRGVNRFSSQMGAEADWSSPVRDGGRIRPPVSERKVKMREFTEASEQLAYEHSRAEESAQQKIPEPPLWRVAKAKADKLMAAGINDSKDYDPRYGPK